MENKRVIMTKYGIKIFFSVLLFAVTTVTHAQVSKDEKQINKCWKIFNKSGYDSYSKGIAKLRKYMGKQESSSLLAYESLVAMEYRKYSRDSELFNFEITVETDGEKNDSLTRTFQDMMQNLYRSHFLDVCRMSTIESTSPTADVYLRQMLVDEDPDTSISEKGQSYFDEAEEFFIKEDFELAELNYRKAIAEDEGFYKAILYLGDSFWAREDYDSAMVYYNMAKEMQPKLLEPRIYIVDALVEKGLYYRAKKECIEAMMVYPGYNLKYKLQRILLVENKYMNEHRFIRYFYPNEMGNESQGTLEGDPIWFDYRSAKEDVSKYCDETGIIEDNGEIKDRYLEIYSMRTMLEKHSDDLPKYLHFADKMREEGFLEPYVFISMFHIDIYPQFKDYMSIEENRDKCRKYIENYLIEPA